MIDKTNKKSDIRNGLNSLSKIDVIELNDNTGEWKPVCIPSDINPIVAYIEKDKEDLVDFAPYYIKEGTFAKQEISFDIEITEDTLTGLLNAPVLYSLTTNINTDSYSANIFGNKSQTFKELCFELNSCFINANFKVSEGKLVFCHNKRGINEVSIVDNNLISSLSNTPILNPPILGENYTNYTGNFVSIDLPWNPDLVGVLSDRPFMYVRSNTLNPNTLRIAWFE